MRILTLTVILGLPLMALGQTEPQQTQEQTKETQRTAPTKGRRRKPAEGQTNPKAKPETGTKVGGQTRVKGRAAEETKNHSGQRARMGATRADARGGQT